MAEEIGEEIIIYTYSRLGNGFAFPYKETDASPYLANVKESIDNEWSGWKAKRYYNIDPNNLEASVDEIANLIASIFLDDQVLIIRTKDMPSDQCLFILNYFTPFGVSPIFNLFTPEMVYHTSDAYVRPSVSGLTPYSVDLFNKFSSDWISIKGKYPFAMMYRPSDPNKFYNWYRQLVSMNSFSFSS